MITKVIFIGLCTLICGVIVREYGSLFSIAVFLIGTILISSIILPYILTVYNKSIAYLNLLNIEVEVFEPVMKVTLIALSTKTASELCKDRGERALGFKIELAGVVAGIICSFPLLDKALSLINAL